MKRIKSQELARRPIPPDIVKRKGNITSSNRELGFLVLLSVAVVSRFDLARRCWKSTLPLRVSLIFCVRFASQRRSE